MQLIHGFLFGLVFFYPMKIAIKQLKLSKPKDYGILFENEEKEIQAYKILLTQARDTPIENELEWIKIKNEFKWIGGCMDDNAPHYYEILEDLINKRTRDYDHYLELCERQEEMFFKYEFFSDELSDYEEIDLIEFACKPLENDDFEVVESLLGWSYAKGWKFRTPKEKYQTFLDLKNAIKQKELKEIEMQKRVDASTKSYLDRMKPYNGR